jgi:hypothetical protein
MSRSTTQVVRDQVHEILIDVYDSVNDHFLGTVSQDGDFVLQVALVVERPGSDDDRVRVFAYHSPLASSSPQAGSKFAFDTPRLGAVRWRDLIDSQLPHTLTAPTEEEDTVGEILSVARIPFTSWSGRHAVRGAMAVDLSRPKVFDRTILESLTVATRKIATVLARAGCDCPIDTLAPTSSFEELARTLRGHLRAKHIRVELADPTRSDPVIAASDGTLPLIPQDDDEEEWLLPMIVSPRDGSFSHDTSTERMGVREAYTSDAYLLRVPMHLDANRIGDVVAAWDLDTIIDDPMDYATRRSQRIGEILACWMTCCWNRVETSVEPVCPVQPGEITTWRCTPRLRALYQRERPSGRGNCADALHIPASFERITAIQKTSH